MSLEHVLQELKSGEKLEFIVDDKASADGSPRLYINLHAKTDYSTYGAKCYYTLNECYIFNAEPDWMSGVVRKMVQTLRAHIEHNEGFRREAENGEP